MNPSDPSTHNSPNADWLLLGELKLLNDANTHVRVNAWLLETLSPLNLHVDLLDTICKSTNDATTNLVGSNPAMLQFEHIHLLVFSQSRQASGLQTWGFFRIEKVEPALEDSNPSDHSIELYLYLEG